MHRSHLFVVIFAVVSVPALGSTLGCTDAKTTGSLPTDEVADTTSDRAMPVSFTDVTAQAGLGDFRHETGAFGQKWFPEAMGGGGGFLDYDGDGRLDVVLVGGGALTERAARKQPVPALRLYRNAGDGSFTERTDEAGLSKLFAYGFGVTAADYDNDGDQDLFLTTLRRDKLLRNDDGVFTEVGVQAGVAGGEHWSTCSIFFDADQDGFLDLYVCGYTKWSPQEDLDCRLGEVASYCPPEDYTGIGGRFYHNNGDGTFDERTDAAGFLPSPGKSLGVAEADFNDDGWPDLIVANDSQRNLLYLSEGDGTFTEKAVLSGVAYASDGHPRGGMGIDVGHLYGEKEATIFIGNFSRQSLGVFHQVNNELFVDRAGAFDVSRPSIRTLTFGLFLFDADLDTDLDLFVANGHIQAAVDKIQNGISYRQPVQLYLNQGEHTFREMDAPQTSVLSQPLVARGAAYGDVDQDGDQDVLITENGGPAHLWRNDRENGHYLRVALEGRRSNRDGIGTRLVAVAGGKRMVRRVRTGSSYLSQSEKTATFGLGARSRVDTLWAYWPSGSVARLTDLEGNRELLIVEGKEKARAQVEASRLQ